jgi:signal transduction histidine kinase
VSGGGPPRLGLRLTVTLAFAGLAFAVSAILAAGTYFTARHYLVEQRQQGAARQAFADASFVRDGLLTSGATVSDVLGSISPSSGSVVLLHRGGQWYSSSLTLGAEAVPAGLRGHVEDGRAALSWARLEGKPVAVVGVALPAVGGEFYEVTPSGMLDSTLRTLAVVLSAFALLTAVGGAVIGRVASARVVKPLDTLAGAAAQIAAGQLDTRLPPTQDPDLSVLVGSFNAMVEALEERIEREARFAADVSHELRSPVTTLTTSVGVLAAVQDDLSERGRQALALVEREVARLRRSLEHLLALARLDAGLADADRVEVDLTDLTAHTLEESQRPASVLHPPERPALVLGDKQMLNRALLNLFDNADLHGGGLSAVHIDLQDGRAQIVVDDAGPGVPPEERLRIFERFARSGSRGSLTGTGLGLSLVAETAAAHGGAVWCVSSPEGGARFVLSLPVVPRPVWSPS